MSTAPTPFEVGRQLVDLCRQGRFAEVVDRFYAADIVSLEGFDMPHMPRRVEGLAAVKKKGEWWESAHEIHGCEVGEPFASADKFACTFLMDVTDKATGKRMKMSEVAVYTVRDGKIVHEEFLYAPH